MPRRSTLAVVAAIAVALTALVGCTSDGVAAERPPTAEANRDAAGDPGDLGLDAAPPPGTPAAHRLELQAAVAAAEADPPEKMIVRSLVSVDKKLDRSNLCDGNWSETTAKPVEGEISMYAEGQTEPGLRIPLTEVDMTSTTTCETLVQYVGEQGAMTKRPILVDVGPHTVLRCENAAGAVGWIGPRTVDRSICDPVKGWVKWNVLSSLGAIAELGACHECDFSGLDLEGVIFGTGNRPRTEDGGNSVVFENVSFDGATILTSGFDSATIRGATFHGATLRDVDLSLGPRGTGNWSNVSFAADGDLPAATLVRVTLPQTLKDSVLDGARLHDVTPSNFGTRFEGCVSMRGTVAVDAVGSPLAGIQFDPSSGEGECVAPYRGSMVDFAAAPALRSSDLTDAVLLVDEYHPDVFAYGDLQGVRWNGVSFLGPRPVLSGTSFRGADLRGVDLSSIRFYENNTADGAERWVDFTGAKLQGANLEGAELQKAVFANADVAGASFRRADLSATSFTTATLVDGAGAHADLSYAYAPGIDLSGVDATKVPFVGAHLYRWSAGDGATSDVRPAKLAGATLAGADFTGAVLGNADLSAIKAQGAIFNRAVCIACKMDGATIADASFLEATLLGSDLTNVVDWKGARFAGALIGTENGTRQLPIAAWELVDPLDYPATKYPTGPRSGSLGSCPDEHTPTGSEDCTGHWAAKEIPDSTTCRSAGPFRCPGVISKWPDQPQPAGSRPTMVARNAVRDEWLIVSTDDASGKVSLGFVTAEGRTDVANRQIGIPSAVAAAPDGSYYVADWDNHRVWQVVRNPGSSSVSTVPFAGTGTRGTTGDKGPARSATLDAPAGLWVGPEGEVYISDERAGTVRKVSVDRTIDTFVTGGLTKPLGLTGDRRGNLFIADPGAHLVWQVGPNGDPYPFAGDGTDRAPDQCESTCKARETSFGTPTAVALVPVQSVYADANAPAWSLLVNDEDDHVVRVVNSLGLVEEPIVGAFEAGDSGDGGPATDARLTQPSWIWSDPSATQLFVVDYSTGRIRLVRTR